MLDNRYLLLKKEFPDLQKNVLMKNHVTFEIGGPAEYFLVAKGAQEVRRTAMLAKKMSIPLFVFGGGSNLLVADKGIKGLVVKVQNDGISLKKDKVVADAGVALPALVEFSIRHSMAGLEWAGGLPGTFGGAVRGNAGAFGGEIKDLIFRVTALNRKFNVRQLGNKACKFGYRSSIFKEKDWIVLSAVLKMKKGNEEELHEIAQSRVTYRKEKHPLEYPNAGSIFKNVPLSVFTPALRQSFAGVVKQDPFSVVPTAYLIAEMGLKGKKKGRAQISEKHPNFIINLGGAKARDVLGLVDEVKASAKKTFHIALETEVQMVGF